MSSYKSSLEKLGYRLQDFGDHWRTRAVYRNGKTATSVLIYKNSGVWRDFGGDEQSKPFELLVQETLKTKDPKILKQYLINGSQSNQPKQVIYERIEMEKIYPKEYLQELLPITEFYEKKKIQISVQKEFDCGYAGSGKMYRRIVFPIYNLDGQIHGFSGRTVATQKDSSTGIQPPKWKHIGKKHNWIYPHHISRDHISEKKEVILVESIGDCLALNQSGYKNVLVTFGLTASSKLISYLNAFDLDRIIISTNDDSSKEENGGQIAAIKTAAKLSQIFDLDLIKINPPTSNDFGDMLQENECFETWYQRKDRWALSDPKIQLWIVKKIQTSEKLSKSVDCKKLIKILKK